MRAPFTLSDAGELSRLLESAGLSRLCDTRRNRERPLRLGGDVRRHYIGGSPLAAIVAMAPEQAYEKLVSEVKRGLDSCIEQNSLCFPIEAHLAVCRA
jgi:hypothetical protein